MFVSKMFVIHFLVPLAHAQTSSVSVGPSVAALTPTPAIDAIVTNVYNFAFMIGGLLAFGAVVYGAFKYTFSVGSPSAQSDARDQITQALLGLLLLLGSYVVLNTISPNLTSLQLPSLEKVQPQEVQQPGAPTPGPQTTCQGSQCQNSPAVQAVLSCLPAPYKNVTATTYQGSHAQNSCHFGGRSCTDGSHAIDWGFNALRAANLTPDQMISAAQQCGAQVSCRCETPEGASIVSCSDPSANHIHCNVDNSACGCN